MADEMMFTVDAEQILVKLHFAALQATKGSTGKGKFFVNTGIVDDDPDGTPEKIGKTKFNLDNPTGQYCVGYVTDLEFTKSFKLENAVNDIFKLRSELYGQDKALLDKDQPEDQEKAKRFEECGRMINDALKLAGEKQYTDEDFQDEKKLKYMQTIIANLIKRNKNVISKMSDYNQQLSSKKDEAAAVLQKYMNVFAGADNVQKIGAKNVFEEQVSSKAAGPNDGIIEDKTFAIKPISEKEEAALDASFKSKSAKSPDGEVLCTVKLCFYVLYTLNVNEQ